MSTRRPSASATSPAGRSLIRPPIGRRTSPTTSPSTHGDLAALDLARAAAAATAMSPGPDAVARTDEHAVVRVVRDGRADRAALESEARDVAEADPARSRGGAPAPRCRATSTDGSREVEHERLRRQAAGDDADHPRPARRGGCERRARRPSAGAAGAPTGASTPAPASRAPRRATIDRRPATSRPACHTRAGSHESRRSKHRTSAW